MTKPNILIFMTDHQRADTALPEHPAITPRLTELVHDGISFTNCSTIITPTATTCTLPVLGYVAKNDTTRCVM